MIFNLKFNQLLLAVSLFFIFISSGLVNAAPSSQELKNSINNKSNELQELLEQRQKVEKNLDELGGEKLTLNRELKKIKYQISRLDLSIRSSEVNLEKLGLEVKSLNFDIKDIGGKIINKKEAIAALLRELQQKDNENLMIIILRHKNLSASLSEVQNLFDFNNGLSSEINNLKDLGSNLTLKLDDVNDKKSQKKRETQNLKSRRFIKTNQKDERRILLSKTRNKERIYQQELKDLKKRQAEISIEINTIESELRATLDPSLLPIPRPGVLGYPVDSEKRITQRFGAVSSLYGGKPHNGLDLRARLAVPILAAEKGKVLMVVNQDKFCRRGAYGKLVLIEHDNNLTTLYAHLSRQEVKKGDIVNKGELIGYSGNTGYSFGSHLHFGVYASQTVTIRQSRVCGLMPYGAPLNPLDYLDF